MKIMPGKPLPTSEGNLSFKCYFLHVGLDLILNRHAGQGRLVREDGASLKSRIKLNITLFVQRGRTEYIVVNSMALAVQHVSVTCHELHSFTGPLLQ